MAVSAAEEGKQSKQAEQEGYHQAEIFSGSAPPDQSLGAGRSFGEGQARVTYPNVANGEPGKVWKFWNYEPEGAIGWYHYGEGTVGHDAKHVHPGPDAMMYKVTMSGCCPVDDEEFAPGPAPGSLKRGDPVSISSGLFVLQKTDLLVPDLIPIVL